MRAAVHAFLAEPSPDAPPPLGDSLAAARAAFSILKARLCPSAPLGAPGADSHGQQLHDQLAKLRAQVCVLRESWSTDVHAIDIVWRARHAGAAARPGDPRLGGPAEGARPGCSEAVGSATGTADAVGCHRTSTRGRHGPGVTGWALGSGSSAFCCMQGACLTLLGRFADPGAEYDAFQRGHMRAAAMDENKALLRAKYGEAKALGREVRLGIWWQSEVPRRTELMRDSQCHASGERQQAVHLSTQGRH